MSALDHFVVAVPDLARASADFAAGFGVTPTVGGVHPDHGTCNSLLSLGNATYLELLGPDTHATAASPWRERMARLSTPDIWTFAVATDGLDGAAAAARAMGIEVRGPTPGSRRTPSGELLRWRTAYLISPRWKGLLPFLIDWMDSPHPSRHSAAGLELQECCVLHPQAAELQAVYDGIGLAVPVRYGLRPAIVATLRGPKGTSMLVGGAEGLF